MESPARRSFTRSAGALLAGLLAASASAALDLKPDEIQERYRRVLSTLSAGDEERAMSALFDLETRAVGESAGTRQLERYWRLKLKVIRELLESGPLDQLVPIVVLHHEAFAMYRDRDEPLLAAHSRTMSSELAEIVADRSDDPQIDLFAGWVLTSFGSYLQETRSVSSSARFFIRALRLSPRNRAALLGIAASHEKYAEYAEAIPYLERALEIDRRDDHARIRLALCLRRAGDTEAAYEHLRKLIAGAGSEWVRSLAFQEAARMHREDGDPGKAEKVLREALEILPDEQQPRVQLAAYLDLDRRPQEARAVLEGLRPVGGGGEGSPRYIYDQWPTEGISEARGTLREMMESRLYLLARGLGRESTTGVGS